MAASSGVMVACDGDYAENRRLGVGILPAGRQVKGGNMFWWGMIIGIFIGTFMGVAVMAICIVGRKD